jgi:hypothetical protein
MKTAVFDLVKGIIDDGHAKLVDNPDVPPGTPLFYLPIHVDKKKYPKYRICQDGAAKVRGRSLNDKLLAGPDLLNSLVGILQKFRQNPIALTADVKGLFHQIFVDEDGSAVFRFFWFEDESMKTFAKH